MQHFVLGENVGLVIPKFNKEDDCFFISNNIIAHKLCSAYDSNSIFPLYLYPEKNGQQTINPTTERTPNLNKELVTQIATKLGLSFTNEKDTTTGISTNRFVRLYLRSFTFAHVQRKVQGVFKD